MARFVPYGRSIYNKRKAHEKIGLLIVATGWHAGQYFTDRQRVVRCVVPDDQVLTHGNLMFMIGLDVLVCPDDQTSSDRLFEVCTACFTLGRASQVWCEIDPQAATRMFLHSGAAYASDSSVPLEGLAPAIKRQQQVMMLMREGIYADPATHDEAVAALLASTMTDEGPHGGN